MCKQKANGLDAKPVWVGTVMFRRERLSKYENGIAIGNNPDDIWRIVDKEFKAVNRTPYSFTVLPYNGCFWTEI